MVMVIDMSPWTYLGGPPADEFSDPDTGLQALRTLLLLFLLLLVLRLFHFSTDRRQTSHTHRRQHCPQSHSGGFSS